MKAIFGLLASILVLLSPVVAPNTEEATTTIYTNDFEGQSLEGWAVTTAGEDTYFKVADISGNKALSVRSPKTTATAANGVLTLGQSLTSDYTVKFKFKLSTDNFDPYKFHWFHVLHNKEIDLVVDQPWSSTQMELACRYSGSNYDVKIVDFNKWYELKLVAKFASQTYDVYLDGVLVKSCGFYNDPNWQSNKLLVGDRETGGSLSSDTVDAGQAFWDNILVTQVAAATPPQCTWPTNCTGFQHPDCASEWACIDGKCVWSCNKDTLPPNETLVKESVKCVFYNSTTEQSCKSEKAACSGVSTCVADVSGASGTKLTWTSTCGGYAYTVIDGENQYASFYCVPTSTASGGGGGGQGVVVGCKVGEDCQSATVVSSPTSAVGGGQSAQVPTATTICRIDDSLMSQYNMLIKQLNSATASGDASAAQAITNKIMALKQQMEQNRICETVAVQTATAIAEPAMPVIDKCAELNQWREKLQYYEKLYALTDADLKMKGFARDEVVKIKLELRDGLARIEKECNLKTAGDTSASTTAENPVAASTSSEITGYYKMKLNTVVSSGGSVDEQIRGLKALRGEIDDLIGRLVKEKEKFAFDDVKDLVQQVEVTPTQIVVDDNNITATNKEISTNIGDTNVTVKQSEGGVSLEDGLHTAQVTGDSITIGEGTLKIGKNTIAVTPSEAMLAARLFPKEISVEEQGGQAVYNISSETGKKLFWVVPVVVKEGAIVNAETGEVISKTAPWWGALAFG